MSSIDPGRYDSCPHCKAGKPIRYRDDTREFVHTYVNGSGVSHTICQANDLRKEDASNG